MTARDPEPTRALVICDGAAVPAELEAQPWDAREHVTSVGADPTLTLVVDNLAAKVGGEPDPHVLDLVRLAAYCFAADRAVDRVRPVDVHREGWCRDLTLCVPVADPAFWSAEERLGALTRALGFGTDDRWAFAFDQAPPEGGQLRIRWGAPLPDQTEVTALYASPPDTVVLFSGGVDSLCALVEVIHAQKRRPIAVSHWPARHVQARQTRLLLDAQRKLGVRDTPHVAFEIHGKGEEEGGSSQRTRGFLFACLGAAVAAHVGVAEVVLADNGYVSVNPPINDQLVGALASRGTHPKFLRLLNRFLASVFGGAVRVTNPLWDRTRAEAMGALVAAGCPELLRLTYSCGNFRGREAGKTHCGGCSQCVDRRMAALAAGLAAHDPVDRYELDLFVVDLPECEPRTIALSYVRFADEVRGTDPDRLFEAYPALQDCLDPDDPAFAVQAVGIADLLKRHADEVIGAIGAKYGELGTAIADRDLPDHALLRLWAGASGAPELVAAVAPFGVEVRPRRSRFVRAGKVWLIDFRNERGGLENRDGARRLARLLRESPTALEALDLVAESAPRAKPARGATEARRTSAQGDAGTVLDEAAVKDYRRRLAELDAEFPAAEAGGDAPTAALLRHERDWLRKELRAGLAKGGKLRAHPEEHERARSTVSKTVWGQVDELQEPMPQLHAHLRRWIHLGYLCWYAPTTPEPWDTGP